MAKYGKQSLDNLKGVHPNLVKVMMKAIENSPVDYTITDSGRTDGMQYNLWLKGRDKKGNIIDKSKIVTELDGYKKKSNHQAKSDGYYYAIDLYPYINGKIDFNDKENKLPVIAAHILATAKCLGINIGWGGYFGSKTGDGWDKPHFELK